MLKKIIEWYKLRKRIKRFLKIYPGCLIHYNRQAKKIVIITKEMDIIC